MTVNSSLYITIPTHTHTLTSHNTTIFNAKHILFTKRTVRSSKYIVFDKKSIPIVACTENTRRILTHTHTHTHTHTTHTTHAQTRIHCKTATVAQTVTP